MPLTAFLCSEARAVVTTGQRSSRMILMAATLAVGAHLAVHNAYAEIIIDDFTDDLRLDFPEQNREIVHTEDVGDLQALRRTNVSGLQTVPSGFVDVNQTQPSALSADIPTTSAPGSTPFLWINLTYSFTTIPLDGVDLSESGQNDAVMLDFAQLSATAPLPAIQLLVQQQIMEDGILTGATYVNSISPIPQSSEPFTLVFPFEEFYVGRGSPIPGFDFSRIREFEVLVRLLFLDPNAPQQLDFEMTLERIRVGRIIPEPSTLLNCLLMSGFLCIARCRRDVCPGSFKRECDHVEANARGSSGLVGIRGLRELHDSDR